MKVAIAQTASVTGDVPLNIESHCRLINNAAATGAAMIVFPELSLTGYEPQQAEQLAMQLDDSRLDIFQTLANSYQLTICVGAPTRSRAGLHISLIIFQPRQPVSVYCKQHLHADEKPYFKPGRKSAPINVGRAKVALAICYEITMPRHAARAARSGATLYVASVAKHAAGVKQAYERLREAARVHGMPTMMANCTGENDGMHCSGGSAVWSSQGKMLSQLNALDEGIISFDTATQECSRFQCSMRDAAGGAKAVPSGQFKLVEELTAQQIEQLHGLMQQQWWGEHRTLQQVQHMTRHTSLMLALIDTGSGELAAYCRVITDFTFRATIYDVMVVQHHQGAGLGSWLMEALCNHPMLKPVSVIVLCCDAQLEGFYRKWDFKPYDGRAGWMMRPQGAE